MARPISVSESHAARYGDDRHWERVHTHLLAPALREAGFDPISPEARGAHDIHGEIIRHLMEDDLVLADFSTLNPNVMFEAGIRTSMQKPLVIVAENGTALPFDTGAINTLHYDPSLRVDTVAADLKKLTEHISDTDMKGNGLLHWFKIETTSTASLTDLGASRESVHGAQLQMLMHMVEDVRASQESERSDRLFREGRRRNDLVEAQQPGSRLADGVAVKRGDQSGLWKTLSLALSDRELALLVDALREINSGGRSARSLQAIEEIATVDRQLPPKYADRVKWAVSQLRVIAMEGKLDLEWLSAFHPSLTTGRLSDDSRPRAKVRARPANPSPRPENE